MEAKYNTTCRAAVLLHALPTLNDNPNREYIWNNRTSFWETNHIIINMFFFVRLRNDWDVTIQCWPLCLDDLWHGVRYDVTWSAIWSTESWELQRPKCRLGYWNPYHWLLPYLISTNIIQDETERVCCRCLLPSQTPLLSFTRLEAGRPVLLTRLEAGRPVLLRCIDPCVLTGYDEGSCSVLQLLCRLYCEMLHF
jgi:hypothetical protein